MKMPNPVLNLEISSNQLPNISPTPDASYAEIPSMLRPNAVGAHKHAASLRLVDVVTPVTAK